MSVTVRIGLAAIPSRTDALKQVIASLLPQADQICVSLNGFSTVPEFLTHRKVTALLAPNLGDFQKFQFLAEFSGYYITCDDDIIYGPSFVDTIISGIEKYNRRAVVGWHGSLLKSPFSDYYDKNSRDVFTFRSAITSDRCVDVLGTGCAGFHTDTMRPPMEIFIRPSMADVYLAKYARQQSIPMVLLAHPANALTPIETESSISSDSIAQTSSALNVRSEVNKLAAELLDLPFQVSSLPVNIRGGRVAIVGRFADGRWTKGGIYKSCRLMSKMIEASGWSAVELEIDQPIEQLLTKLTTDATRCDMAIIYTGDQQAQDFYAVGAIVSACLNASMPVAVNLSIDLHPTRTDEIVDFLNKHQHHPNLYVVTFAREAKSLPELSAISDRLVVLPKTIQAVPNLEEVPFERRSGILLGDIGKLTNPRLTPDPLPYLRAIKARLPSVQLYCVSQYQSKEPPAAEIADLVSIVPYHDNVVNLFSKFRMYLHLQRWCTFEMLPVEAMSSGLPVAYIDMPHSLNEYIGLSGLHFEEPGDMAQKIEAVYGSPKLWAMMAASGVARAASVDTRNLGFQMRVALAKIIDRSRGAQDV